MTEAPTSTTNIIVAGAGPAGLLAAGVLADLGLRVVLAGRRPLAPPTDTLIAGVRTAALFPASMSVLERTGAAATLIPACQRLAAIRILDGMGGLLRAPEVMFRAHEIGLERLATNVPLGPLGDALAAAIGRKPGVRWIDGLVDAIEIADGGVTITTSTAERVEARLLVAADGHDSPARKAAGIGADAWSYDQTGLVAAFEHTHPHQDVSTEVHRPGGPCTTVPLPDGPGGEHRSSLVWLERAAIATRLLALDDAAFIQALSMHVAGHTGRITRITPRASHPMRGLTAREFGRARIALVGETAHVFPPLGAQGLNLTVRDVAALAGCVADALAAGRDIGGAETLAAYSRTRSVDVTARAFGVGAINSILLSGVPGAGLARGLALHAIASVPALKRQIMRAGMSPVGAMPRALLPPLPILHGEREG